MDCTWALAYLLDCGNNMIQVNDLKRKENELLEVFFCFVLDYC